VTTGAEVLVARSGRVATITLHRPDALNALTPTMLSALGDELEQLSSDESITVVVLTGSGRAFCAGVDLKALGDRELVGGSVGDLLDVPARRVTALPRRCRPGGASRPARRARRCGRRTVGLAAGQQP